MVVTFEIHFLAHSGSIHGWDPVWSRLDDNSMLADHFSLSLSWNWVDSKELFGKHDKFSEMFDFC